MTNSASADGRAIDAQLEQLVGSGNLLRVKVWGPDGTVVYSDLPALRGQRFEVEEDLAEAFDGEVVDDISDGTAAETRSSTASRTGSSRSTCWSRDPTEGRRRLRDLSRTCG